MTTATQIRVVLLLLFVSIACRSAFAQSSNLYLVAGIGSQEGKQVSQGAIGGEFVFHRLVGAGAEVGAVAGHDSFATFSVNSYLHVPLPGLEKRVDPFATIGYTAGASILGSTNLLNFGGGIHYWFHRRLGLRLEGRDLVHPGGRSGSTQIWSFRAGIAFR
jgi:hypothetical protein